MQVQVLKPAENITLKPIADTQYVLIPQGNVSVDVILEKEGISAELFALYSLRNDQQVNLQTRSVHAVPNTFCTVNIKAALFDSSKSDYKGQIIIQKPAQQTVSYLEDNVLVVGSKAKNNSQPILEIEADDVKASHGATTGRVDEDQIYYLMSRGLNHEESEQLIINGFFEALLAKIHDEKIRAEVTRELHVQG